MKQLVFSPIGALVCIAAYSPYSELYSTVHVYGKLCTYEFSFVLSWREISIMVESLPILCG